MNARWLAGVAALGVLALAPTVAGARGLGVEVWADRGDDAVYQPGEAMEIRARASDDAYLLVYEIDAEGYVRLLYPYRGSSGFVEGRRTYPVPPERSNVDLVVQGPVGQCYVVAIVARDRFRELPWYLRPYDLQAEQVGYEGMRDDEEGITAEGRIVGDPFVAMERIRRRVLGDAQDADAFGTSYATYYVHNEVRHPRYLCYDCHRPGRWAWWPGFDPYYASCSVFDYRINWGWGWGPGYWFGSVPYYYYVVRYDCPPRYRPYYQDHARFSSWDGWRRWNSMWGNRLVRYKSDPPSGYVPPSKFRDRGAGRDGRPGPPGFITTDARKGRDGLRPSLVIGRNFETRPRETEPREGATVGRRQGPGTGRPTVERMPSREVIRDPQGGRGPGRGAAFRERGGRPLPPVEEAPRVERSRAEKPREQPREERSPRYEQPRDDRPADKPRDQRPSNPGRSSDAPRGGQRTRG
jgi:hypothetical protein